ncbi:MotA/TolQ/ExbB proton channel family protein [Mangrovibacterium diazotrophicum]|uniref:Methyl-accepting chemotaxis protein n=1 Tax=Mangrovibacterium diazotrophicum TaxID=1261403 RepID=A0A419W3J4_9BACT|nr:MotA/TolQ/ExbB proton channel family protein [Mangrovibacterium diazotrophicum]RKD90046.1 methyl-accepting chemotaxis protein [Mangrovibacterium diazotrophicum]
MDYLERIFPFPYVNQQSFDENRLTGYWVLFTILITLLSLIYILGRGYVIKRALAFNSLSKSKSLKATWRAYQKSFSSYGAEFKTPVHAEEYINENNIFFNFLNFRLVNNMSSIIVGIGILGTFVGLAFGIAGIKTTEGTEQLAQSIDSLMAGMSTAFVTSIWGMGLSLLFTGVFKFWQTRVSRVIQSTCFELDAKYMVSEDEVQKQREQKQREIIGELFNEYLVAETSEGKQLPKNVFRRILEESEKQTASLQSFSDDLADSITAAMELLVSENNTQISKLIEEKLVPVLNDLKAIKQDSGTQIIESAIDRLAKSMKEMLDEFKRSIAGDTKNELEGLTKQLAEVATSITNVPGTMAEISGTVKEMIETLKETVIENIKNTKAEAAVQSEETRKAFIAAKEEYTTSIGDIQAHMELMLASQKDNIKQIADLTKTINETLTTNSHVNKQFENLVFKTKEISRTFERITSTLSDNSKQISASSDDLHKSTHEFKSSIENYIKKNHELLGTHQETLGKAVEASDQYIKKFNVIESGLTGIFGQVQTGLQDYQTVTAQNLNHYLREFTTQLTNAQKGLESNIANLSEIAEDLTEQIEKYNGRR